LKHHNPRPIANIVPSEPEIDEERAKIALAHGIKLPPGEYTRMELRRQHASRTELAQEMDDHLVARRAKTQKEWRRRPNKVDIIGIDRFPLEVQRDFVTHFPEQVAMMEDYYDTETNVLEYKIYASWDEWGEKASRSVGGFYRPEDQSIHINPYAAKVISDGEIKNAEEYQYFQSIFHEVGHGMGPGGYAHEINHVGEPQEFFGEGFDEGVNEILSQRFIMDNIKMPRDLRRKLTRTETHDRVLYEQSSSYTDSQRTSAEIALLAGRGDERAAIDWLARLRYADTEADARRAIKQLDREIERAKKNTARIHGKDSYSMENVKGVDSKWLLNFSTRSSQAQSNIANNLLEANGYDNPYSPNSPRSKKYEYHLKVKTQIIDRDATGKLRALQEDKETGVRMIAPWWLIV
jgi:hypothetical protein